jgi:FixJ family two-component response regulator
MVKRQSLSSGCFDVLPQMEYEPKARLGDCSALWGLRAESYVVNKTLVHLVEDDAALRATLVRLLESGGNVVKQYSSGTELLAKSCSIEEGFILLNINMPGLDGFAIQRELAGKGIRSPVILMTGAGDLTLLALKAGATDFMQKPFDRGQFLSALDDIGERRRTDA